jgi:MFS family permease
MTEQPQRSLPVSLWLGGVLAGCSLALLGVAALAPRIVPAVGLTPESVGLFSGVAWGAALLASLASAPLVARRGAWSVARLCVLTCAAGVLCVAFGHPALFWLGAVLIGIGQGLESPPASQLLGHHVPMAARPFFFSLKQMGVQVGAVVASLSLPALTLLVGWQAALWVVAAVLLVLAWRLGLPARRYGLHRAPGTNTGMAGAALRGLVSWVAVLRQDPALLRLGLAASTFGATQVCMNTFLVTWMVTQRGASLTTAGALAATAQGAGLLGRPLWGWVASRGGGSHRVLLWLGLMMSACSALLGTLGAALPTLALFVLAAAFGLSASGWNGLFLSEVTAGRTGDRIGAGTAAAMVPVFVGLIIGPISFAGVGHWLDLSAGFVMLAGVAMAGTLLVFSIRRPANIGGS